MTPSDDIANYMRQKTTEELLAIWAKNDRIQWSDAAFDAIGKVFTERGVSAPPQQTTATPPPKYKGVGGWLLFFCISLTILSPIVTVVNLVSSYNASDQYFGEFPGLKAITLLDILLSSAVMGFSIYAGICLWREAPGAVRMAKRYLLCFLGYLVIADILPFTAGLPSSANDVMIMEVVKAAVRGLVFFAVWYSYLNKSERVKATYPS